MNRKLLQELGDIIDDYESLPEFVEKYNDMTSFEFDHYAVSSLSLFLVHENYDFENVNSVLDKIEYTMPSIKRIFAKPIIHLTDQNEVLPVEAVRLVNNDTIHHIASHCELWDDVTENGIKPVKLLTKTYRDNYSIYENIVFVKSVNCILNYLRKNMRELRNLMYACKSLEFNLLERVNHLEYFLAIGKLHTGYIRNLGKYYDITKSSLERMELIYNTLMPRLKRNVYRLNANYKGRFTLHNSNILHMQKDYHRVYILLKHFKKIKEEPITLTNDQIDGFYNKYLDYLKVITIFSITHFNFEAKPKSKINFNNLNVDFMFHNWNLTLKETSNKKGLILECFKNKKYSIAIYPSFERVDINESEADEIVYATPFSSESLYSYISITDVDSFRRIQRFIQKVMVYSDNVFDDCFFCGETLQNVSIHGKDEKTYLCKSCRTIVEEKYCETTDKNFYLTRIDNYHITPNEYNIDTSEMMHFRNITGLTSKGDFVCPHCLKVHKK